VRVGFGFDNLHVHSPLRIFLLHVALFQRSEFPNWDKQTIFPLIENNNKKVNKGNHPSPWKKKTKKLLGVNYIEPAKVQPGFEVPTTFVQVWSTQTRNYPTCLIRITYQVFQTLNHTLI
jgi:hypothetical protein